VCRRGSVRCPCRALAVYLALFGVLLFACVGLSVSLLPLAPDLESVVKAHKDAVILCTSPWCRICDRYTDVFDEAAAMLPQIYFTRLAGSDDFAFVKQYGIKRFPTLLYFKSAKVRMFEIVRIHPQSSSRRKHASAASMDRGPYATSFASANGLALLSATPRRVLCSSSSLVHSLLGSCLLDGREKQKLGF